MIQTDPNPEAKTPLFRVPGPRDGAAVHALIQSCAPLDLNSIYAYLLLCSHFAETCALAEREGSPVGFVSGYLKPADPSVLFVWQAAVSPKARGQGVAKRLLTEILRRPGCRDVRYLEATIGPSNKASWALFESFARCIGAESVRTTMFQADDFGTQHHEEEQLLRIGPFTAESVQRVLP